MLASTFFTIVGIIILTAIVARYAIGLAGGVWMCLIFSGKAPVGLSVCAVVVLAALAGVAYLDWSVISEHVSFH